MPLDSFLVLIPTSLPSFEKQNLSQKESTFPTKRCWTIDSPRDQLTLVPQKALSDDTSSMLDSIDAINRGHYSTFSINVGKLAIAKML